MDKTRRLIRSARDFDLEGALNGIACVLGLHAPAPALALRDGRANPVTICRNCARQL